MAALVNNLPSILVGIGLILGLAYVMDKTKRGEKKSDASCGQGCCSCGANAETVGEPHTPE